VKVVVDGFPHNRPDNLYAFFRAAITSSFRVVTTASGVSTLVWSRFPPGVGVSRIFLSHSSSNNAEAVALRDWLGNEGWDDIFLDTDPERGIATGERWERALNQAANRCEAVLFLVSRAWLDSDWCLKEFNLAHRLNKRMFGVLIEDIPFVGLPVNLTSTWQTVALAAGRDHVMLRATMPVTGEEVHITFSTEGLGRLKNGLKRAGLDPRFFAWPPENDSNRAPYRGLLPLEAEDAGIFFGRDAPMIEALDRLHGLRLGAPPRLLIILGASGAGKSSFLRAGLLPRLVRDDRNFLALPVVRPERAAINGETGLLQAVESALRVSGLAYARAEIRRAILAGASGLRPLLQKLSGQAFAAHLAEESRERPPIFVLPIDQGEELFLAEGTDEAEQLLTIIHDLLADDRPGMLVLITMRSDSYERLQSSKALEGIPQATLSLPPMPLGAYQLVIDGPAARLRDTARRLYIEPALTEALLADIESGGGRDALPLLAFTLERLFLEYGARGRLTLSDYEALGRIKGSIEAAVERALVAADANSKIPRDRGTRLALLRRGFIPWLAGIDPETNSPRRRVARLSEIPVEARPLIDLLKEQHLLATDVAQDSGEVTIEPAHEALLRQWGMLQGWLEEDFAALAILEGVKRAARDWAANAKDAGWLIHTGVRLRDAERISLRESLARFVAPTDHHYLTACKQLDDSERTFAEMTSTTAPVRLIALAVLVGTIGGLAVAVMSTIVGLMQETLFHLPGGQRLAARLAIDPVRLLSVPLLGGLLLGASTEIIKRWRPEREVDPMEANALHGGRMSLTGSMIVALQTVWSGGVGAGVGLEAGYAQAVSGIASRIGRAFRLRRGDLRVLVGCGAAAGVAGALAAPLAGAFYGFEVIVGSYAPSSLAPVAIAALIGYSVAERLAPVDVGVVGADKVTIVSHDLVMAALIGLLAALLGIVLMRGVALCELLFTRLAPRPAWRTMVGGFCIGIFAIVSPHVLSSGYGAIRIAGLLDMSFRAIALLFVLKISSVIVSLGSGFRGGMFFTSLLIGALGGHLLAAGLTMTFPAFYFDPGAYSVIGMSALAASVIGGPLTMMFIAIETTSDLWLTMLVLIAVSISTLVTREAYGYSFPTWRLYRRDETNPQSVS
jgi:H+/Cl- antiporter ClcA